MTNALAAVQPEASSTSFQWLLTADLAEVQKRAPALAPKIEAIMRGIDPDKPLTIIEAASPYRDVLTKVGLDAAAAVSKINEADALKNVSVFRKALERSLEPKGTDVSTMGRAKELASAAGGRLLGIAHKAAASIGLAKPPSTIPTAAELEARIAKLQGDAKELDEFIRETTANALAMEAGIKLGEARTKTVGEQTEVLRRAHSDATEGLLLTLVAVRTLAEQYKDPVDASQREAVDLERLQQRQRVSGWLERAITDLTADVTRQALQRGVLDGLEALNMDARTELANVKSTVLPATANMMTILRMELATAQSAAIAGAAHGILRDATAQIAKGLDKTAEIASKANDARHESIAAIPAAIGAVTATFRDYREQLALASQRESEAQARHIDGVRGLAELAKQTGLLRAASGHAALAAPSRTAESDTRLIADKGGDPKSTP